MSSIDDEEDLSNDNDNNEWSIEVKIFYIIENFRRNQLETIDKMFNGKDVFMLMPTDGGKLTLPVVCNGR
ncbi:24340_t:CDS:2 [Entrophospora sp. SA101]|nr:15112_t:CDS:2 [Entrophospora sp. SA101]CAJ0641101.1 14449_t:CDS:2 [Entrophospora sp. SA101]CAJ0760835.1 24340_t:CDS:2 [Entrophospora sp. SA101]CAJ0846758.1 6069_t:CDS:2 [Entrophospora sp. SA101]